MKNNPNKGKFTDSKKTEDTETKKKVKCFYCEKLGHMAKDCRKKKADQKRKKGSKSKEEQPTSDTAHVTTGELFLTEHCSAYAMGNGKDGWFVDSGASKHMSNNKEWFTTMSDSAPDSKVIVGDNRSCPVKGVGSIPFITSSGEEKVISGVLYVPDLCKNLLSVSQMNKHKMAVLFDNREVIIKSKETGQVVAKGIEENGLYRLSALLVHGDNGKSKLWHERFGHVNYGTLTEMQKEHMVDGLPPIAATGRVCRACLEGKQHRDKFPKEATTRATVPLELVHSDICGPMSTNTFAGSRYSLLFIDDYSRMTWVYCLAKKSQAFDKFKEWRAKVEKEIGRPVKTFRTDRGGEYTSDEFNAYCRKHGIQRQLTAARTSQQNGVAERKHRTSVEMSLTMLKGRNLSKAYWGEAITTAVHILNRTKTKAVAAKTPYEAYYGKKPTISHLRIFGSNAFVHVHKDLRTKLDSKNRKCILVGYCEESKAYRLFDPARRQILISRDVVFEETEHGAVDEVQELPQ